MRDAREIIRLKSSLVSTHGTAILPARPRKPREKTKVEQAMLIVERWLLGARPTRATDLHQSRRRRRRAWRAALDRTQPGLPLKPGKCGTMTHDYKRNGTTTLFAALNILDGTVIGRCMRRHRHQEFIQFLNGVERAVPAGKIIHAIVDNYAAHKQPNVLKWIADHPRWTFHFTPTSASWLNPVEGFFSAISRRRIRRGAFTSVGDLQNAIDRYIDAHNNDCRPFVWTTSAKAIFEKLAQIPVPSV